MTENIRLAIHAIYQHRLRSLLTMLGIIVGIASIISIVSIINGNTENMKKQLIVCLIMPRNYQKESCKSC